MKKAILIVIGLLFTIIISAQDIEGFVNRQLEIYPKSRLLDIYKSSSQDYMGAEHLVSDRQRVKAYLDEELQTARLDNLMPWYYEPCGVNGQYIRVSITIPITDGRLNLGTWQGIYFCEFRNFGGSRELVVTIIGE